MMATESPKERSDEATITSSTETARQFDSDSQNADVNRPHVNGDSTGGGSTDELSLKHISDIVDDLVNSTEVSVSGGSDNEASKGDASKSKEDGKGHVQTSSTVKKPASFKAISVNKTFLYPKGSAPTTQTKPLEKPTSPLSSSPTPSSAMSASRPRLVAKTGSGLVTKTSGANGSKSTPDANAVWNKNRPVPPPEPKKYTDEELKKYGIHMASRLGPEDVKGENNWADIEDDDEDWAPETITWKDGTKVTIPHAEEHPTPVLTPAVPTPTPEQPASRKEGEVLDKAKELATSAVLAVTAPAAPAAPPPVIKTTVLASGKGLVLKGAPEKPTLVAKPPPPPAPVKSPWAPIPKPDKVSPIIEPPSQSGPKYPPRDPSFSGDARLAPKEIAADDFSRSAWRGGPPHNNRELYNSQSGTYEPVADRRGSFRSDQPGRQPALLHRPPPHEQGPFDSSGPYPAGRNNEQPGSYGRRRGSSNVSGGSGSFHRLKTLDHPMPPPELVNARRGSMTGGSDGPASPRNFSPSGLQGGPRHLQGWPPRVSPGTTHATPYHQGGPAPGPHAQEMMPPPHQQSPLVANASLVGVTDQDLELQKKLMRERRELAMKRRQEQEAKEEAEKQERIKAKLAALGFAPESNSAKKAANKDNTPTLTQSTAEKSTEESKSGEKPLSAAPSESNQKPESLQNGLLLQGLPPSEPDAPPHTHTHPWPSTSKPADRYPAASSWGPQPPTASKIWGAPNNNRTLGNGTFVSELGTAQLPHQLPGKPGPGPIAPPGRSRDSSQANSGALSNRLPPIGPPRPAPRSEQTLGGAAAATERNEVANTWATAVGLQDDAFAKMMNAKWSDRDRRLKEAGMSLTDIQPVIKDTWRQVKLDAEGRRIDTAAKQTIKIGNENPWAAAEAKAMSSQLETSRSGTAAPEYGHLSQSTINTRDLSSTSILGAPTAPQRGSRFFPQSRDIRLETESSRPKSPSPPPPDMPGHPAFDGDIAHPHVSLPCPRPVVKLPPSAAAKETKTPTFSWASQVAYKGDEGIPTGPSSDRSPSLNNAQGAEWQARIDNLLGGRKNHPHPRSPVGLDFGDRPAQARPGSSSSSQAASGPIGSPTTKVMAEECFEEQEMGSLPPVRLPNVVPELAWQPVLAPKPLPKKFYAAVSTADAISFPVSMSGAGTIWYVSFPGAERKEIVVPHGRNRSNPRRGGQRGGRSNGSSSNYRQGKGRDVSSPYQGNEPGLASSSHAPQGRGGRGGYRSRDNWSRNSPAPIQT